MPVAVLKPEASHYEPLNKKANARSNDCIWSLSPWVLEAL